MCKSYQSLPFTYSKCSLSLELQCKQIERKDRASKTSPTCYHPNSSHLHWHTQTRIRGQRRRASLKPSRIAGIHQLYSVLTLPSECMGTWTIYTQLTEHRDSRSHAKTWNWSFDGVKHTGMSVWFRKVYSVFLEWPAARGPAPHHWGWIPSWSWGSLNAKTSSPFITLNLFRFKVGVFVQVYQASRWASISIVGINSNVHQFMIITAKYNS